MSWYLNPALTRFRAAVNARWPSRDKTSDGTIGDPAHQATNSDHNPDPAGQPDAGSVDAWDMDVDGVDVELLKRAFQAHPASWYWIHRRQIASRDNGWRREPYDGANPHDKHVHWNTRESHEASTAPWLIADLENDMPTAKEIAAEVWNHPLTDPLTGKPKPAGAFQRYSDAMHVTTRQALKPLSDLLLGIARRVDLDPAEIEHLKTALAVPSAQDNAAAVVAKLGAAATAEEKAALLRAALGDDAVPVGRLLAGDVTPTAA